MTEESTALIPISEEKGLVARVERNLSAQITYGHVDKDMNSIQRVSDLYVSRYGIMGYVEYGVVQEYISGIIEVPKRLALFVHAALGDDLYKEWNSQVFGLSTLLDDHPEDLQIPQLAGATFLDKTYLWAPKPEAHQLSGVMKDDIDDCLREVLDTLKTADTTIDNIFGRTAPEPRYDTFQIIRIGR